MRAENIEICEVEALFVGPEFNTDLWVSDAAIAEIHGLDGIDKKRFLKKLKSFAEVGFSEHEHRDGPIRHEKDSGGVYRVAHTVKSLFRLIGFYGAAKTEFIAIAAFRKRGQKLSGPQRDRIRKVAMVKQQGAWKKRQT